MAALSDYMEGLVLDIITGGTVYLALFTSPTADDGSGDEATGAGYERQVITFTTVGGNVLESDAVVSYTGLDATAITYAAIMDSTTSGNMLIHGVLASPVTPTTGEVYFDIGDVTFSID